MPFLGGLAGTSQALRVKAEQGGHTESRRLGVGVGMCGLVGVSTCTCAERERRELEWEEVGWGT